MTGLIFQVNRLIGTTLRFPRLYNDLAACGFTKSTECPMELFRCLESLNHGTPLFGDDFRTDWSYYSLLPTNEVVGFIQALKVAVEFKRSIPDFIPEHLRETMVISLTDEAREFVTELSGWLPDRLPTQVKMPISFGGKRKEQLTIACTGAAVGASSGIHDSHACHWLRQCTTKSARDSLPRGGVDVGNRYGKSGLRCDALLPTSSSQKQNLSGPPAADSRKPSSYCATGAPPPSRERATLTNTLARNKQRPTEQPNRYQGRWL